MAEVEPGASKQRGNQSEQRCEEINTTNPGRLIGKHQPIAYREVVQISEVTCFSHTSNNSPPNIRQSKQNPMPSLDYSRNKGDLVGTGMLIMLPAYRG